MKYLNSTWLEKNLPCDYGTYPPQLFNLSQSQHVLCERPSTHYNYKQFTSFSLFNRVKRRIIPFWQQNYCYFLECKFQFIRYYISMILIWFFLMANVKNQFVRLIFYFFCLDLNLWPPILFFRNSNQLNYLTSTMKRLTPTISIIRNRNLLFIRNCCAILHSSNRCIPLFTTWLVVSFVGPLLYNIPCLVIAVLPNAPHNTMVTF